MHNKENTATIIRSLSGLVNYQGLVVGVSDEYHGLFVRGPAGDQFYNFSNYPPALSYKDQKKLKPDHESISVLSWKGHDYLITFPSLSRPNRTHLGVFQISKNEEQLQIHSEKNFQLFHLLSRLQVQSEINIEGHLMNTQHLLLLNRGNQTAASELIKIENSDSWLDSVFNSESDSQFQYAVSRTNVDLGVYQGHPIHWTDGVWENENTILFLASVEKTDNAYDDGDVLASFLGRFDVNTRTVLGIKKILDNKKAEGICKWNSRYLVAIDSDSPEMANEFYSLSLDVLN